MLAIGGSMLSISAAGFDQYFAIAKSVSDQVLDEKRRSKFVDVSCPRTAKVIDDPCTAKFVSDEAASFSVDR